jgi:hypothetical protein
MFCEIRFRSNGTELRRSVQAKTQSQIAAFAFFRLRGVLDR